MRTPRTDTALLLGGGAIYLAALAVLVGTGHTEVRFSADDSDTQPIWLLWIPAIAGLCLAWMVPPRESAADPFADTGTRALTIRTWLLAGAAVAFTVALYLSPATDIWFLALKALLLLAIPLALRIVTWREWARLDVRGRWLRPLPAVIAFVLVASVLRPGSEVATPDVLTIVVVFLINAVLEEVFYRFWLQTRLESRYGRWPAILVTSLLWASWHAAIHGGEGLAVDLAAVVLNIGVTGLFLGYLWSRHRNPWLNIVVHGFINAPIAMFIAMA
ncbi:CPBP family intramembrane metalloprotease [Nocardia uniformis]|uniref:CPBP family intramembrane metalloprotease n=1 Tax=Nocardia uniformis TaxID=53432 RepID=A0A849C1D3_9NOCA|nr:CPBP family intramembrane glutamic endopeptidase [Nocardia uniformis]NNH68809.1 CPBP family intramembrane metalloprotease [Nocardia uniformis]